MTRSVTLLVPTVAKPHESDESKGLSNHPQITQMTQIPVLGFGAWSFCEAASGGGIQQLGLGNDLVAEVPAQVLGSPHIGLSPEQFRQLDFQPGQGEQAGDVFRLELDKDVNVAVRPKGLPEHRAKERQLADMMPAAELSQPGAVDNNLGTHTSV